MSPNSATQIGQRRSLLFCLGLVSGLAFWLLAENSDNPDLPPALFLALLSFVGSYATLALALSGPVSVTRAMVGALLLAVPFTALTFLAGQRYVVATDVLDQPILVGLSLLFLLISTPFLIVTLQNRHAWNDYAELFEAAWALTLRYLMAWIFVGLFWLMMFLSDALLSLVDLEIIEWIFDTEWLEFCLTGGVLGLAMAVVYELRTTVSPFLLLRLLRLFVVPVLAVITLFLAAIPLQGLSQVFGNLSAAVTLMSVAMVMLTLIAVVLERDDARMRPSVTIITSTRFLALLLPAVTGLAAWAIWVRVNDYGWTPDRVLAALVSAVLLSYGLLYALSVLLQQGWSSWIRRINVVLALVTIAISAAFLTPLLNAERLAANNQIARYLDGRLQLSELPVWELEHDWGQAGRAALARLENGPDGQDPDLIQRLADMRISSSKWGLDNEIRSRTDAEVEAELLDLLPVLPAGQTLAVGDLQGVARYKLKRWLSGCQRLLADGRPGCVLVMDQFTPETARSGVLLYRRGDKGRRIEIDSLIVDDTGEASSKGAVMFNAGEGTPLKISDLEAILDGDYSVGPSSLKALHVGGIEILPQP